MRLVLLIVQSPWSLENCDIISNVLCARYIKLSTTAQEMKELIGGMENKYVFPQAFGCVDSKHIPIV